MSFCRLAHQGRETELFALLQELFCLSLAKVYIFQTVKRSQLAQQFLTLPIDVLPRMT